MTANQPGRVPEERIYVLCPAELVTGGSELLHQLVGRLIAIGKDARIAYLPLGEVWRTPEAYERYECPVAFHVPDEPGVAVIVPEVSTRELYAFKKSRHVIWWLSVDNYRDGFRRGEPIFQFVRRLVKPEIPRASSATHLFQSAYARNFVASRFGCRGAMLGDYLADEYLLNSPQQSRIDAVAFNPRKGLAFTREFLSANPTLKAVPLANMNRAEVKRTLETCKVYIDFGEHPGKDRLPREAAACGAVVIVGLKGSAANNEDLPLPPQYKLRVATSSIAQLSSLVSEVFEKFAEHQEKQGCFRETIAREKQEFERQVIEVFGLA